MLTNESVELVKSREVTPLIETIRAKLPMAAIARTEMIVADPDFRIDNEVQEATVNGYMRDTSTWAAQVKEHWKPVKSFWDTIHAAACDAERDTAPAIGRIRTACDKAMKTWLNRKAEAARQRQAAIDRNTETLRRQTEKEAKSLAMDGKLEEAEALLQDSIAMRSPIIMSEPPKLDGTAIKPVWVPTVTDHMALIKAIADGRIPLMHTVTIKGKEEERPLLDISETVLKFYANKLGKQLNWPGVDVTADMSFAARRR